MMSIIFLFSQTIPRIIQLKLNKFTSHCFIYFLQHRTTILHQVLCPYSKHSFTYLSFSFTQCILCRILYYLQNSFCLYILSYRHTRSPYIGQHKYHRVDRGSGYCSCRFLETRGMLMLKWSLSIALVSLLPRNIHLSSTSDTHIDQRLILNINRNLIKSLKLDIRNISYRWFGVVVT